jgi:hypothetical protein
VLRVRNFSKFQHYKHRSPPWIKLHRTALHDYHFTCLQDASKAHAMLLWLLASTCDNAIPDDVQWIARQIHATDPIDIEALVSAGILERYEEPKRKQRASKALAPRKQNGGTEGEREESRVENNKLPSTPSPNGGESVAGDVRDVAPKVTWITPSVVAWEAVYGPGSCDIGQATRELAPLYAKGKGLSPEVIGKRLAFYLRQKGIEGDPTREQVQRANFRPSLRDFRLRHGAFDPTLPAFGEAA